MASEASRDDIEILNDLISITLDSADGYEKAAEETTAQDLKVLFSRRARERRQIVHDLQARVRALGGEPEDDGTILGKAHRVFIGLKASVAGNDNKAVINEVERGEDQIKARYEKALNHENLSDPSREVVQRAYVSIKAGHDQVSAMKHAAE
jgi:uncharacterized protein (TIGR02284 family)